MRFGIIADDLTGACDVAGRLVRLGHRPTVYANASRAGSAVRTLALAHENATAIVLNTRSRESSRREAGTRARAAARALKSAGIPVLYQKIDSTLRGPWAESLRQIVSVVHPHLVLICPAFPATGRLVRRGQVWVRGTNERGLLPTASWEGRSDLGAILQQRCGWEVRRVGLDPVRRGRGAIPIALGPRGASKFPQVIVFDAERERDLAAIASTFRKATLPILWVGSGGLVRHVIPRPAAPEPSPQFGPVAPWLLIQGSQQAISQRQFQQLEKDMQIRTLRLSTASSRTQRRGWTDEVIAELAAGRNVAIVPPPVFDPSISALFSRFLHPRLRKISRHIRLGGVFISGGSTAEAVCDSLCLRRLQVVEEVRPGIPLSIALDGRLPGLHVVTKAGGFGGRKEVERVLERVSL